MGALDRVNEDGLTNDSRGNRLTDQVMYQGSDTAFNGVVLLPAVPVDDTFWGYTSAPDNDIAWWRALPLSPNLPSIPLTPRQRLFLASHPQEDKEAALQELLAAECANLVIELAKLGKQQAKTVASLRKARADKKRLLAEWQATIDRDSQHLCSVRRKTAMLLQRMLDGDDVTEDARDFVMRLQSMQDVHDEHVHEACCLIDDLATMYGVGDVLCDVAEGVEGLQVFARQMRKLGIAGVPS